MDMLLWPEKGIHNNYEKKNRAAKDLNILKNKSIIEGFINQWYEILIHKVVSFFTTNSQF